MTDMRIQVHLGLCFAHCEDENSDRVNHHNEKRRVGRGSRRQPNPFIRLHPVYEYNIHQGRNDQCIIVQSGSSLGRILLFLYLYVFSISNDVIFFGSATSLFCYGWTIHQQISVLDRQIDETSIEMKLLIQAHQMEKLLISELKSMSNGDLVSSSSLGDHLL